MFHLLIATTVVFWTLELIFFWIANVGVTFGSTSISNLLRRSVLRGEIIPLQVGRGPSLFSPWWVKEEERGRFEKLKVRRLFAQPLANALAAEQGEECYSTANYAFLLCLPPARSRLVLCFERRDDTTLGAASLQGIRTQQIPLQAL